MEEELHVSGLSIAPKVFETIVQKAAEGVEGVASVGVPATNSTSLFSFLTGAAARQQPQTPAVGVRTQEGGIAVAVHVTAFFGYPFLTLASDVRREVASMVETLTGLDVVSVDVFIDALVFPKE